ncbi:DUF3089 domain-containing protein [Maritimibacter sp. UBA3975]|uniref:DUF3089 domain-containing protein n=1 Tax=Maritimibacter sp. UBA3975 TaxID=1946833 RepID=UPI000C0AB410|nr:DUF3089 domain-containing protein [Maritimibacter sp. UBA3975]MAM60772.1 lysophospholipase [Maritimibacter sp.]|tara:strand:- start:33998 stop:35125 length:1128 start_codon:yes stop_codon:yes gene_type:complete
MNRNLLAAIAALGLSSPAFAQTPDYGDAANWLCRPGVEGPCAANLDTTVIEADGSTRREDFVAAEDPGVDCFYVYPTVSTDSTPNSDMQADPAERTVAERQFARFGEVCRLYAPLYRQVTLAGLRAQLSGSNAGTDWAMAMGDVGAAFRQYIENDNDGRPFVLIGHSQGSIMLEPLIARAVAGTPLADQLLSAILVGTNVERPTGEPSGGDLASLPRCESAQDTGCAISYVTFLEGATPPEGGLFGRAEGEGMQVGCTDPAALLGRDELMPYFPVEYGGSARQGDPWLADGEIGTGWVSTPGLLSAECIDRDGAQFLSLKVHAEPEDPRADDIGGELTVMGNPSPQWGLHLIEMYATQGDLIELVRQQAAAHMTD